ncbi:hypothetical protein Droror1_Dr00013644 [Drosera rotundifolia]
MGNGAQKSKIMRIVAMPMKLLSKARDSYVKGMNSYADFNYYGGGAAFGPSMTGNPLPRSFSTSSMRAKETEDLRDLVRAASSKTFGEKIDMNACLKEEQRKAATAAAMPATVPRSGSVAMGRIDEDKACEFEEEEDKGYDCNLERLKEEKKGLGGLIPRSRSHAAARKTLVAF